MSKFTTSSVTICPLNNSFKPNHACPCLGFGKVFNVLNSPIGQKASRLKRDVEKLPLRQIYVYFSLVKRKQAVYSILSRIEGAIWFD